MNDFLEQEYFNNTVLDYLIAVGIVLIGVSLVRLLQTKLLKRFKKWSAKTDAKVDDFIVKSIERYGIPALYYFIIYAALNYLILKPKVQHIVEVATMVVITYFVIRLFSSTVLLLLQNYIRKQERGEEKVNQLGGLMMILNIIIWILGIVFLIDNLGGNVTAIVTGLGIGGIAIALAAQNILGDLFNYFVIFFDRPFEVGDFIIVDDKMGTIEYIGIKTTRIRSLSGEQVVIGNSNLTTSRIHNYKRLNRRRVVFSIDIEYGTPLESLKELPGLLRTIVEQQALVTFDRAHFAKYADWSLRFEVVYYVLDADYNKFMDIQQNINFMIYEEFGKRGIGFAFPTESVFLNASKKIERGIEHALQAKVNQENP